MNNEINFNAAFTTLTGYPPFPWQAALYQRFIAGDFPSSCNLPTGLGKTSVVAIWLIALASHPTKFPRRLVYVVNRRTVVDQATDVAEKIRKRLQDVPTVAEALRKMCATEADDQKWSPLAISTLRGQFADNEEWSFDPARPAVVVGTVDMIGSRLLFSGYGIGRYDRTHQVGLVGCETLLVHDEAHLTDPFQQLLNAIVREQHKESEAGRGLRVLELTATTRHREGRPTPFGLGAEDETHPIVLDRIDAAKTITLHPVKDVTREIVKLAAGHKDSGRAILVFVQTPDQVNEVKEELIGREHKIPENRIVTLTGTMRGYERDQLPTSDIFARYLPDPQVSPAEGTVYLVCTSAGEVGIDISADDMVCDLSTYESMAQRFGRVNRRGGIDPGTGQPRQADIDIVHELEIDSATPRGERRELTRRLLQRVVDEHARSVSPRTLRDLPDKDKTDAFGPPVPTLDTTDILLDAWALTTITDDLPGRPPVAQWLHGVEPPDQPTTSFAWREDVLLLAPKADADDATIKARANEIKEYLDEYPLKHHEKLAERTARLVSVPNADPSETGRRQHLKEFAKRAANLPAWLIDIKGRVTLTTIEKLTELDFGSLVGRTVVLPPKAGGLSKAGMLDGRADRDPERRYDVADEKKADGPRTRYRTISDINEYEERTERAVVGELPDDDASKRGHYREVAEIALGEAPEGDTSRLFVAWVAADAIEGEESRSRQARFKQYLADHLEQAEKYAETLAERLLPAGPEQTAVRLAAKWHDLGKDRDVWQNGIWNHRSRDDEEWKPLAKSGRVGRILGLNGYRHEFGSLIDIYSDPEFGGLEEKTKELVLHLIATHHGRGRPHFPANEAFDPGTPDAAQAALPPDVPRRFATLQREYGRWGLAYLESLIRAADILASQKPGQSRAEKVIRRPKVVVPVPKRPLPEPTIRITVDLTNPGQFFACCGLLELADRLWPGAEGWFEEREFCITCGGTLAELIQAVNSAKLTQMDADDDTGSAIEVGPPFRPLRLDWWQDDRAGGKELKVWAGSMESYGIARAMQVAMRGGQFHSPRLFDFGMVVPDPADSKKKKEPYYFDARRGPNAHSRDVGFSPNDLGMTTTAFPAVELLCLVGLQRCLPAKTNQPRLFDYYTWALPLPPGLLPPVVAHELTFPDSRGYRFENWYRTGQKKHKAFRSAIPLSTGV